MQSPELHDHEEQKETKASGSKKVLPFLSQAYLA